MDTLTQVHLASQYLATAGKSFLEPKSDDSHTNVGFFSEDTTLRTWNLDTTGTYLAFSYVDIELQWVSNTKKEVLPLQGRSHDEIVSWISDMASESKFKNPYTYDLHYDLPYSPEGDFTFNLTNEEELKKLIYLRSLAQNAIKSFLNKENLESDIRIWPHHFDTGAFVVLNDGSEKSVGLGLAIPDSMINEHYFYISGYNGHNSIDTSNFESLSIGEWKNDGFNGGVLRITNTEETNAVKFLQEAFATYTG